MDWNDDYEGPEEPTNEATLDVKVSIQWNNDAVIKQVVRKLAGRIYDDIKPQVQKAILEGLDSQVNLAISALLDKEIQPTDRWGQITGEQISIRALLQRDAEVWLVENVDYQGRKGSESYGQKHSRIHWIIQEALNEPKDRRGKTHLQQMVVNAAKDTIGDVTAVVEAEVKAQAKKALGL